MELLFATLVALLPAAIILLDLRHGGGSIGENSFTQWSQAALLCASTVLYWIAARKQPQSRALLALIAGFFTCMLIREHDWLFESIHHGFWFYPAMAAAVATITLARRQRGTFLAPAASFVRSRPYAVLLMGLIIVFVFSRVFGSGNLLWQEVMGDRYISHQKTVIQEGLELFGYGILFLGSWMHHVHAIYPAHPKPVSRRELR